MNGSEWRTLLKWMIWGYHYFRKHPYLSTFYQQYDGISLSHHMKIHILSALKQETCQIHCASLISLLGLKIARLHSYTVGKRRTTSEIPINQPTLHGTSHARSVPSAHLMYENSLCKVHGEDHLSILPLAISKLENYPAAWWNLIY